MKHTLIVRNKTLFQSSDFNPIENIWNVVELEIHTMDVQPTKPQQLRDAVISIQTTDQSSEECFQLLVESMPQRVNAILKAKVGQILARCI